MNDDAVAAAAEIGAVLDGLGVPYMVGGSMASAVWGEPRFTLDVDLVAALGPGDVAGLVDALRDDWYVDEAAVREAVRTRSSFNLIRLRRMVKVDVFVPPDIGLHASKWTRVRRARLDPENDLELPITSPEDIVLQKLAWFREGGGVSESQWRDVTALLRIRREDLDQAYLDEWSARMGLTDLLARARSEA